MKFRIGFWFSVHSQKFFFADLQCRISPSVFRCYSLEVSTIMPITPLFISSNNLSYLTLRNDTIGWRYFLRAIFSVIVSTSYHPQAIWAAFQSMLCIFRALSYRRVTYLRAFHIIVWFFLNFYTPVDLCCLHNAYYVWWNNDFVAIWKCCIIFRRNTLGPTTE